MEKCKSKFAEDLALNRIIELGSVSRSQLPNQLREADFFLHAFVGSLDKSVVEATFCKIPVISINPEYINEFGKWSTGTCSLTLNSELVAFLTMDEKKRNRIIDERCYIAREKHSFNSWILRLRKVLEIDNQ